MLSASERFSCLVTRQRHKRCVIVAPKAVKIEAVNKVSTWRKIGAVAQVAGKHAGRNRTLNAVMGAARTTARSFGRAAHQLWLEVMGLFFLIMALGFATGTVKEYGKYHSGSAGFSRLAIALCCTLTFAWFGLSSFWRARRKGHRP
jgi:hypothetical protein